MAHHRAMQPRQIYASTVTRRERRRLRSRGRGARGVALVTLATLVAAIVVLAAVTPGLS
jgi:hypothetical protein